MSSFQFPTSSSPPSTPDRRDGGRQFSFGKSNPSTTPAGPPPSSAGSFTPSGPPPSSIMSSSGAGPFNSQPISSLNFSKDSVLNPSKTTNQSPKSFPSVAPYVHSSKATQPSALSNEFKAPKSMEFSANFAEDEDDMEDADGDYEDRHDGLQEGDYSDEADGRMEDDEPDDDYSDEDQGMADPRFDSSGPAPRLNGRSQGDSLRSNDPVDLRSSLGVSRNGIPHESTYGPIAKGILKQLGVAPVNESNDVILGTEELVIRLYEEGIKATEEEDALQETLMIIPSELLKLWLDYNNSTAAHVSEEYAATIGPGTKACKFANANFLASLLLRLRHPPRTSVSVNNSSLRSSLLRGSLPPSHEGKPKQIPLLLLEWMDDYHDPYPSQLDEIQGHRPSPAHHRLFWDTILNSLLRGRVVAVANALKTAGWKYAANAVDDGRDKSLQNSYSGVALANIEKVIGDAIQVLQMCPAMRGDWDIRGSDWTLFRLRVDQALENLKRFAESRDRGVADREGFGTSSKALTYTGIARKAESQVPWDIYQNLLTMYNLMLGDRSCIIENAQDWCESAIGLVVWWNPGKDDRRLALNHSTVSGTESASIYLRKLADSFYRTTVESKDFQVNTLNAAEVGLACIFEGDYEAAIGLMHSWSGPIASATAEIGSLGGWLTISEAPSLIEMDSLDQDDMDVLGLGQPVEVDDIKDHILISYAKHLAQKHKLESSPSFGRPKVVREGWEVAIEVLGRLNSASRSDKEVGRMLDDVQFESSDTVDKLWRLLNDLSMTNHADNIAEEWADDLAENSFKYGEAMWYYSLAHKPKKVKDVLDLLISFSLIHSVAYPPEAEVDDHLKRLISSPKTTLTELATMDDEAGRLLHKMFSGYATLRRFYDLRDEEVRLSAGEKPKIGTHARRSEAVTALMTVISSSDDNIRGGLFDEARDAVVSVDFLLALLGEAMVFVNQPTTGVNSSQIITLLKAIEDLQTIPPRIYAAADEFFQTVIASTQGLKGSSPMDLLRKSTSNLSGTSSFSLVGSSMLASQLQRSIGSSGVLVKGNIKRGWDWRKGLSAGTTSGNVLQILRLGLANDLARVWLAEADGQM